jgi:riboflavin kinase/FMN adenylyltransferase
MTAGRTPHRVATLETLPEAWRGGVVAIGNFDGMHRGHQAVLAAALAEAEHLKVPCIMLTFEPHPRAFFSGRPMFRLTPAPLKAALAAALGVDGTLVLPFDRTRAEQSAEDFVREVLIGKLNLSAAVAGHDFHFGKARRGTPQFLVDQGILNAFSVTIVAALREDHEAVSATRIRRALARGDVRDAAKLLGWHFAVAGTIVHGEKRGRELGYPTANMVLDPASELFNGIYAVRMLRRDGSLLDGVASYGRRPTFGEGAPLLETFAFDFSGDLYGEEVLVAFYGFIRPEEKFSSVEELVARMDQDSIEARALLERTPTGEIDARVYREWEAGES